MKTFIFIVGTIFSNNIEQSVDHMANKTMCSCPRVKHCGKVAGKCKAVCESPAKAFCSCADTESMCGPYGPYGPFENNCKCK